MHFGVDLSRIFAGSVNWSSTIFTVNQLLIAYFASIKYHLCELADGTAHCGFFNMYILLLAGDVIIEVENVTVDDEHHQMVVESLKNAGLSIRLVF